MPITTWLAARDGTPRDRYPQRVSVRLVRVKVITDSTAGLPADSPAEWNIGVVDVQLRVGERIDDERRFSRDEIFESLQAGEHIQTSPPEPGALFWAYQEAVGAGADAIVSLHISGKLSATAESARQACQQIRVPVYVIDTETTGMSLGFAALTAARAAAAGADARRVVAAAQQRYTESSELIYVDTLEYLRRGGRIGGAAAMLGTAFSVKPLITVTDGEVAPLARVPGTRRALAKLVDLAVERAGGRAVDVAIASASMGPRELSLQRDLKERLAAPRQIVLAPASTVIGAHVGPGALGITIAP